MTIGAWVGLGCIALVIALLAAVILMSTYKVWKKILIIVVALILCTAAYGGMRWYFTNTASGQRELIDQQSNLNNGLNRVINIYTANGELLAIYEGKIDIESNDSYIKFDFEGRRYIYYNCFVETIADLP